MAKNAIGIKNSLVIVSLFMINFSVYVTFDAVSKYWLQTGVFFLVLSDFHKDRKNIIFGFPEFNLSLCRQGYSFL